MEQILQRPKIARSGYQSGIKPKLRGWFHLCSAPLVFLAALSLVIFCPTVEGRIGVAIYLLSSMMLFGVSATYHLGSPWPKGIEMIFRRVDHANIFIFIAGTYTPLCLTILKGSSGIMLLCLVWTIAVLGMIFRLAWSKTPRWLYTLLYVIMGWAAVGWLPQIWRAGGAAVVVLLLIGGVIYSLGALAYATKKPNPIPKWFGFHEVFHAATVLAMVCHFVAISMCVFLFS